MNITAQGGALFVIQGNAVFNVTRCRGGQAGVYDLVVHCVQTPLRGLPTLYTGSREHTRHALGLVTEAFSSGRSHLDLSRYKPPT